MTIGRFMDKVELTDSTECWMWTGCLNNMGYPKFKWDSRSVYAHRFSYEHFTGPIPEGLTIDHLCRVPQCVNPDHLEAVTVRVNVLRGDTIAARNSHKTHCPRGHLYAGTNLHTHRGRRVCRACWTLKNAARKEGLTSW